MDDWVFILSTLFFCYFIKILITKLISKTKQKQVTYPLPPGPKSIPVITPLLWLNRSFYDFTTNLRKLHKRYGPIVTLNIASRPAVFIADRHLAHQFLVQHGAELAHRLPAGAASRIVSSNQHSVNTASYGPVWRALRRNLTAEILHPSRIKMYSSARRWVLDILIEKLQLQGRDGNGVVVVMESFQYAMFCLLVLMCFGEKLEQDDIMDILTVQRRLLSGFLKFNVFNMFPKITKIVYRKRWNDLLALRARQEELYIPLIKNRRELKGGEEQQEQGSSYVYCYVNSLLDLQLPENGGRKVSDDEIVSLCSEFLSAGTDTTATALQWIMANIVKQQTVQQKLYKEITETVGTNSGEIKEEDLSKMPYLRAVIMEGLRRHPPGHFLLPHTVDEYIIINDYLIPKGAAVNVAVAEIGWDNKVWKEPMEFRPERFLDGGEGNGVDLTGSREVKMMPFGIGRRICPGMGLALLHLEYFVANLVRVFEWLPIDGEEVDLTETQDFTVVMKNPLRARILTRNKSVAEA